MLRGVAYRTIDGARLEADVYRPRAGGSRPAVVLVHGGGWIIGNRAGWAPVARELARAGFVAVAIEYRLDGPARFPEEIDDVEAAIRWVRDEAVVLRVEPTRVGALGASAGGNLAALAGTRGSGPTDRGGRLAAVASWSGIYALRRLVDRDTTPTGIPPGCRDLGCLPVATLAELVRTYIGVSPPSPRYAAASPIAHLDASDPPMLLAASDREFVPDSQMRAMAERLSARGIDRQVLRYEGDRHAGQLVDDALAPTIRFLRNHLGRGSPPAAASA